MNMLKRRRLGFNVSTSSAVPSTPSISVDPTSIAFGNIENGKYSSAVTVDVTGSYLTNNLVVGAVTGFIINLDGSNTNAAPITLIPSGGNVSQTVYVKFHPTAEQAYSGNISLTSIGATQVDIPVSGTGLYDADAVVIMDNMTAAGSTPTTAFKEVINKAVKNLKGTGTQGVANIWALLDCLQMFATLTETQSLVAWKGNNPTKYNSPTYVAKSGWLPASVGSHSLWSNFTPSVNGVNYTQNSCSFGVWLGASPGTSYFMGSLGTNKSAVRTVSTNNDNYCNSSTFGLGNFSTMTEGLFWINRGASGTFKTVKNASVISTVSLASSGLPSWNMAVAGYSNTATTIAAIPSLTNPVKIAFAGAGLEAHATQLYNTFNQYISEVAAL